MPGMLLHIDGSKHRWLNDDRWYDLIVILDDATSEIYYAQLVEEESTRTVMAGLREVIETQGSVLCLVQRPGEPLFRDAEGGREGGQAPADAGGAGDEGAGGADDSRRTRRRRGAGRNGASGPGKGGCRRNCGWQGSRQWRTPIGFCGSSTSGNSMPKYESMNVAELHRQVEELRNRLFDLIEGKPQPEPSKPKRRGPGITLTSRATAIWMQRMLGEGK